MPVSELHPEYRCAKERYELIRAIINNKAQGFLRTPDENDKLRTEQYKADAILTNFTKLTCDGLTGLVFRHDPNVVLPTELEYLIEDATGAGINLYQMSQYSVYEVLQTGRLGYLTDYHNDSGRAFVKPYVAETIINWKAKEINGAVQPWLVVLQEEVLAQSDDIFSQTTECQYRALILDDVYHQLVFDKDCKLISDVVPVDFNGNAFDYIPFRFVGSQNNDWVVDNQPLYDLAVLNLGHYRNSADLEESGFTCGQPYLVVNVGETTQEEFKQANPNGIAYGSRKGLVLSTGGNAQLLQANPNQLIMEMMRDKVLQAAKLGARLIEEAGGRETAEAARIRYGSQHSALYTLTGNISWGLKSALEDVARFMGVQGEIDYELNDEFYDETVDPNLLAQMFMGLDRQTVSKEEIRSTMTKMGIPLDDSTNTDQLEDSFDPMLGAIDGQEST